jgi:CheY-like chemotaxis protein
MARLLETSGFTALEAANGKEALLHMRTQRPCVILLDLQMPIMDGWEFRRQQLADPELAGVPVICVTGFYDPSDIFRGTGVKCFTKPVQLSVLLQAVRDACRTGERPAAAADGGQARKSPPLTRESCTVGPPLVRYGGDASHEQARVHLRIHGAWRSHMEAVPFHLPRRSLLSENTAGTSASESREREDGSRLLKRRGLFAAAWAAAAALVMKKSEQVVQADGTQGTPMTIGAVNTETAGTNLKWAGAVPANTVVFLGNDSFWTPPSAGFPAATAGWAEGDGAPYAGVPNGVYGYTGRTTGNGVVGVSAIGTGAGVLGQKWGAPDSRSSDRRCRTRLIPVGSGATFPRASASTASRSMA